MGNANILIIDDEPGIRRLIKDFLARENMNVIEAEDGSAGLIQFYANEDSLDLIILDVMMPYLDGFEVLKRIRETSSVPVLMLTAKSEEESQVEGIEAGANDYILKPFSPIVLVAKVKSYLRHLTEKEIRFKDIVINIAKRQVLVGGEEIYLTLKEYELLNYLIKNVNVAVPRENIQSEIWGNDKENTRTIDTHIKQLREKLSKSKCEIQTVRGFGYMISDEE